jgi:hypothetical protein
VFGEASNIAREDAIRSHQANTPMNFRFQASICVHGDAIYRLSLGGEDRRGFHRSEHKNSF